MVQPHDILGVDRDADLETIKRAYLRLAHTAHPDAGGSKEEFIQLQAAYEALVEGQNRAGADSSPADYPDANGATDAPPPRGPEWQSYEEIMKAVRRELEEDEGWLPSDEPCGQARASSEFGVAVALTVASAGAISAWFGYDGQSWDITRWTIAFLISVLVLVYVGGLSAMVGASPGSSGLGLYCRVMIFALISAMLPLFHRPQKTTHTPRPKVQSNDYASHWWMPLRGSSHD